MTKQGQLHVTVHIDGGSRGNPGPAAAGFVVRRAGDSAILRQAGVFLGRTTNNVAEYNGLLGGLQAAADLKASEVTIFSDSELLVRQMNGQYRVRNSGLKPLVARAQALAGRFAMCTFRHVRREENAWADGLVNQALDLQADVQGQGG